MWRARERKKSDFQLNHFGFYLLFSAVIFRRVCVVAKKNAFGLNSISMRMRSFMWKNEKYLCLKWMIHGRNRWKCLARPFIIATYFIVKLSKLIKMLMKMHGARTSDRAKRKIEFYVNASWFFSYSSFVSCKLGCFSLSLARARKQHTNWSLWFGTRCSFFLMQAAFLCHFNPNPNKWIQFMRQIKLLFNNNSNATTELQLNTNAWNFILLNANNEHWTVWSRASYAQHQCLCTYTHTHKPIPLCWNAENKECGSR